MAALQGVAASMGPLLMFAWVLEFCGWAILLGGVAAIQNVSEQSKGQGKTVQCCC